MVLMSKTPVSLLIPILCCLVLSIQSSVSVESPCYNSPNSLFEILQCKLFEKEIGIPNQVYNHYGFSLEINQIRCGELLVENEFDMDVNTNNLILLSIYNITAHCQGVYQLQKHNVLVASGEVSLRIEPNPPTNEWSKDPALLTALQIQNEHKVPSQIHVSDCQTHIQVSQLHFSQSTSAEVLDLFRHVLQTSFSQEINDYACKKGKIDRFLTRYLQKFTMKFVDPYIEHNNTFYIKNEPIPNIINFDNDLPFLRTVLVNANRLLHEYAIHGLLKDETMPSCGFSMDGINGILQTLLNQKVPIHIPLHNRPIHSSLILKQVTLDNLQLSPDPLKVLQPHDRVQFLSQAGLSNMTLELDFTYVEDFRLTVDASFFRVLANTWVSADRTLFRDLTVDSLSHYRNSSACLFDSIQEGFLGPFQIDANLSHVFLEPSQASDFSDLLNELLKLVVIGYNELLSLWIHGWTHKEFARLLNQEIQSFLQKHRCSPPVRHIHQPDDPFNNLIPSSMGGTQHFVNLTKIYPLVHLNTWLSTHFRRIHEYLNCTTEVLSSVIKKHKFPFFSVKQFDIVGTDNIKEWKVWNPVEFNKLCNEFVIRGDTNDTQSIAVHSVLEFLGLPLNASATLNISVWTKDVHLLVNSILLFDSNVLGGIPLSDVLASSQCLFVPVSEFQLFGMDTTTTVKSPGFSINGSIVSDAFPPVVIYLDTDYNKAVHILGEQFFQSVFKSLRGLFDIASASSVARSRENCFRTHPKSENDETRGNPFDDSAPILVAVVIFVVAQTGLLIIAKIPNSSGTRESHHHTDDMYGRVNPLQEPLLGGVGRNSASARSVVLSLSEYPHVSLLQRHLLPMLLILSTLLLVSSHVSMSADTSIQITFGDHSFDLRSIFPFDLQHAAKTMWGSHAYISLVIILVFSAIWPYLKLMVLFFCWYRSERYLSAPLREKLLVTSDSLGKFSLVGVYVLVLEVVSFHYRITSSFLEVEGSVTPKYGLYSFVASTGLSLISGHVLVHLNRGELHTRDENFVEPLIEHSFLFRSGERKQLSRRFQGVLLSCLFGSILLLAVGINREIIVVDTGGVAGKMIGPDAHREFSLVSLGREFVNRVPNQRYTAPLLQLVYIFFAAVAPILTLITILALLIFPCSYRHQHFLLHVCEILNAWSGVEVFAISTVVTVLQISSFSASFLERRCDFIFPDEESCLTVNASIRRDFVYLVIGCTLYSWGVSLSLKLARLAIHEMSTPEHGDRDGWIVPLLARWAFVDDESIHEDVGPPVVDNHDWHRESFDQEWKDAAERDPKWKEWKETTSVT